MKKAIVILFSLLLYLSSFAQPYKSCLDGEMTRWSILDYHEIDAGTVSTEIVAYNDTLINNLPYKKLRYDGFDVDYMNLSYDEINTIWRDYVPRLSGYDIWENFYIRESEDASKLYIYDAEKDVEYLISDMNLEKGDKFLINDPRNNPFEVTADSVYIENGLKHIRLVYGYEDSEHITFIESVGPSNWYIYPYDWCYGNFNRVNCFENQTVFYKSNEKIGSYFCACGGRDMWYYSNIKETQSNNCNIFVVSGEIRLFFPENKDIQIFLYDMQGILHYEQRIHSQHIVIPTTRLSKGIYLLKIFDRNKNQMNIEKIIL